MNRLYGIVAAGAVALLLSACKKVSPSESPVPVVAHQIEMSLEELADNVYHVRFATQHEITSTLLRPQEHFESPEFKGKVFTLDEYKRWYTQNSPKGKKTGVFTYFTDWNGFNFPSAVLQPFYHGDFNPLTEQERQFLGLFEGESEPFYVIGTHREKPLDIKKVLKHELGHALFLTSPEYHRGVLTALDGMNQDHRKEIVDYLKSTEGYHPDVFVDETHAHLLASLDKLKEEAGLDVTRFADVNGKLNELFDQHFRPKEEYRFLPTKQ